MGSLWEGREEGAERFPKWQEAMCNIAQRSGARGWN